jgi:hypothetical protein
MCTLALGIIAWAGAIIAMAIATVVVVAVVLLLLRILLQ